MAAPIPSLDDYWNALDARRRRFSAEEQRAAVALYRELAKGLAVDGAQLSRALGVPLEEGRALLHCDAIKGSVYADDQGRALGFSGLAIKPMHHRFEVDGRALSTWCAFDSLFLPEILGRPARISSPDPESGELVRLAVTPERIQSVEPESAVISFILPDDRAFATSAKDVMAKFCHYIYFFSSRCTGESWVARHPGTFLYALDDAFVLAKRYNARNFGPELARLASL
jgi:alkylmercury lyase